MKEELWESFPPRRDGATRGMRADGESREQQQQWRRRWRGWRWRWRRRCRGSRGRSRAARQEPAALPEEAAVGQLPRRRQDVPWHEEGGVFLAHAVPLQGGLHQQHHLPHVRLQGGWKHLDSCRWAGREELSGVRGLTWGGGGHSEGVGVCLLMKLVENEEKVDGKVAENPQKTESRLQLTIAK